MKQKITASKECLALAIAVLLMASGRILAQDTVSAPPSTDSPGISTDTESTAPTDTAGTTSAMAGASDSADSDGTSGVFPSGTGGSGNQLNFQADLFSGRFTYTVPIAVAPGRQGAQPKLALGYNSSGGNGWCGVGWGLEVGYI